MMRSFCLLIGFVWFVFLSPSYRERLTYVKKWVEMKDKEKEKIVGSSALEMLGDYEEEQQRPPKPSGAPVGSWGAVAKEDERGGVNYIAISKGKGSKKQEEEEEEDIDGEPMSDDEDIDGEPM